MRKNTVYIIITILFLSTLANAQFRIKIPKIKKPKVEGLGKTATSGQKRQMVMDDGFTFFDAEPVKEYDRKLQRNVDIGWTLKSHLRLFGDFPTRSAFNVVVGQNGKPQTKIRCETAAIPNPNGYGPYDRIEFGDHYIYTANRGCINIKKVIKGSGEFDVSVYVVNGDTEEETLVRKYKIDVHRAPRVRGSTGNPVPDVAHYYVSRHGSIPASIMYLRGNSHDYNITDKSSRAAENEVEIYFIHSPQKPTDRLPRGYMRCTVNGKFVKFPGPSPYADQVVIRDGRSEYAIYTDRIAREYKTGPAYRDDIIFRQVRALIPIGWGSKRGANRVNMQDYKGDWQCDYKHDGETIRTFRWKVGNDGMPVPHAEQQNGNINLYHNTILLDTEIPAGGSEYDYRLMPMPDKGFFYGINWTTPEGKKMAGEVPKKGNPFHIPSNRAK